MKKRIKIFEARKNSQGRYECHSVREAEVEHNYSSNEFYFTSGVPSDWAAQTDEIFQQSLQSNYQCCQTEYMKQIHEQFELMRQALQSQMPPRTPQREWNP